MLRDVPVTVARHHEPYGTAVAGPLTEKILLRACFDRFDERCVARSGSRANIRCGVGAMRLVDLRVARVQVALVGGSVVWRARSCGIESTNRMLSPRVQVRDIVLGGPDIILRRRLVNHGQDETLLLLRGKEGLHETLSERIRGHMGSSIAVGVGATVQGSAISTKRQSALTRRICSGEWHRARSSAGEATSIESPRARETATLSRLRLNRNSRLRGRSSTLDVAMEKMLTAASCPWKRSTVPTLLPSGSASTRHATCALYGATTTMSSSVSGRSTPLSERQVPRVNCSMISRTREA